MRDKSQFIRLMDVVLLGPYMIWSSRHVKHRYFRIGLSLLGWGTILYNGFNWWQNYQAEKQLEGTPGLQPPTLRQLNQYNVNVGRARPRRTIRHKMPPTGH